MTFKLFLEITSLMIGLFMLGSLACLPLYKWNLRAFYRSKLWVKVYWWWPIYSVLVFVLYFGWPVAVLVAGLLTMQAVREWHHKKAYRLVVPTVYLCLFILAITQLISITLLPNRWEIGLISIGLASVLSDICAFFAGSYSGNHPLPAWINKRKSWEGVFGQIIGAFLGLGMAALTPEIGFSWTLAVVVGVASAGGDILNSVAKRQLSIKDWSQFIPGHGGALDRFSSLSFALAAGYIVLLIRA